MAKKHLEDYLSRLKPDDIVEASQEARTKSMALLNDQGIVGLLVSATIDGSE